jgi:glycosyltransferase involved in cell wall biosynthesis
LRIKVLHIIDSLRQGGAEAMAVNTFNALIKQKNSDTYLCATRLEGTLKANIICKRNYFFLEKKTTIDIRALSKFFSYVKEHEINIIHAHSTSFFIAVLVRLRFSKIKIVWHNHTGANMYLKGWRKIFLKLCSHFFTIIINVNTELDTWVKKNLVRKRSVVINNFAVFVNEHKETTLKGNGINKIVCVAGLRPEKDHLNLLKAFLKLIETQEDCSLHLIGKDYNDIYSKSIKDFIKNNVLDEKVFLYNSCSDIKNILSQTNIGVLSSRTEGLPLALLEYGLAGLPVVITNVGDCAKVVVNNKSGIIIAKENSDELVAGILKLLLDQEKAIVFGNNLKMKVEKEYSEEKYVEALIEVYNTLL